MAAKKRGAVKKQDAQVALARRIALRLMTNGSAELAQRLVLVEDTPVYRDLGGRCQQSVQDCVLEVLLARKGK